MYIRPRRPTCPTFLPEACSINNLLPMTPRLNFEKGSVAQENSKINFIGNQVLPEGPRAVTVSKTGEKSTMVEDIPKDDIPKVNTNIFSGFPGFSACRLPAARSSNRIIPNLYIDRPRANITKRSKGSRRYINQKPRSKYTSRNSVLPPFLASEDFMDLCPNLDAETQTKISTSANPFHPMHKCIHMPYAVPPVPPVPPITPARRFIRENIGDMQHACNNKRDVKIGPENSEVTKFPGICSIISTVALLIAVSWFFATYFELHDILDIYNNVISMVQRWCEKHRAHQPLTNCQLFFRYLRSWWF